MDAAPSFFALLRSGLRSGHPGYFFLPFFALVAFCWVRWMLSVCVAAGAGEDLRIVRVALRLP